MKIEYFNLNLRIHTHNEFESKKSKKNKNKTNRIYISWTTFGRIHSNEYVFNCTIIILFHLYIQK